MNKKTTLFLMMMSCFAIAYGMQHWTAPDYNWVAFKNSNEYLRINKKVFSCASPSDLGVKNIKADEATLYWDDSSGAAWEYLVQLPSDPFPTGSGIPSTTKEVTVTKDYNSNNLQPHTEYEFYVRTDCGTEGKSSWEGPFVFKTICNLFSLPFLDGFETTSLSKDCWVILDNNKDGTVSYNTWRLFNSAGNAYDGTYSMYFYGVNTGVAHDDYLITPTFQLNNTNMYLLTYYYKTNASANTEFEVLLSNSGIDANDFTTTLQSKTIDKTTQYVKKSIYITGQGGNVNIAWRVLSTGAAYLYIDKISLEKVDCISPDEDIKIDDIKKDEATFSWTDSNNSSWEYYVKPAGGGAPVGGGTLAPNKTATVTRVNGSGVNLQPNTEYEFWVRSSCGTGKNSAWVGPVMFRTLCDVQSLPFFEGFNLGTSQSIDCWTILDNNKDSSSASSNIWGLTSNSSQIYQGTHSMYFYGSSSKIPHDDWLISPIFKLDSSKKYRVKYFYRTNTAAKTDFKVMLSNSGTEITDFTTELLFKKDESNNNWTEETLIIGGVKGNVNIAWQVVTSSAITYLHIDNVNIEEISTCPEPIKLGSKDEKADEATVFWSDDYGKDWEYVVQLAGTGTPSVAGITTSVKENVVTQDIKGNNLENNTEYELYVRAKCADGSYSDWSSPYLFKTTCGIFTTPFLETFNDLSPTKRCWTIIDGNKDATNLIYGPNIWIESPTAYEGGKSMCFTGTAGAGKKHDDWLISPKIKFDAGKTYRLKYFYRTHNITTNDYEFEVLLSKDGEDVSKFTTVVLPKQKYEASISWKSEYIFITGVSGDVNVAWHVAVEEKATYLYIDYVEIEEVENCPEPINLGVENVESNSVDIFWSDDMGGSNWEYVVQEEGKGIPVSGGTVTTAKTNKITKDNLGNNLKNNTDYEFYVRTVCPDGSFSMWNGPFKFATDCGILSMPFFEGFEADSETMRCWTILDANGDSTNPAGNDIWKSYNITPYEGALSMQFSGSTNRTHDDYLISPTLPMDNSKYVLKYHYKGFFNASYPYNNHFKVVLSNQGTSVADFTHILKPEQNYEDPAWNEEVIFFDGVPGDVNIAWYIMAENGARNYTAVQIDNVFLKKIETCPEPYYVKVTNQTINSIDIEWQQEGGITDWEIIVVKSGADETSTPVQKVTVTGAAKTTITGLPSGQGYTIYVRAKCTGGNSNSDWSTPVNAGTKVSVNDDCSGAINIPVNDTSECLAFVSGSLFGATESGIAPPLCNRDLKSDVWFEFTATKNIHILTVSNTKSLPQTTLIRQIFGAVYDQPCSAIASELACLTTLGTGDAKVILTNLTVGHKYYVRLGNYPRLDAEGNLVPGQQPDFTFDLCITSLDKAPVEIDESGGKYTVNELIEEVLIQTNCNLVSNINYQNGDGSSQTKMYNTLGYFNKGESDFPFKEGIVLSTNEVQYVGRPYMGYDVPRGNNFFRWVGDKDINDAIDDAGGGPFAAKRVTQIEFDFIPIKDSLSFEFLFASNSYHIGCTYSCDGNGALFATWLTDLTTGERQNLAKLRDNKNTPISIRTVNDGIKRGADFCGLRNPEYYGEYYAAPGMDIKAPIDFAGTTKPMQSRVVHVVPGRKYHIKLAVMDFCEVLSHSSAVFFNAGSFDLGNLDLGEDLLVESNNALCDEESAMLKSGIVLSEELDSTIEWYKDGVLIPGANAPDLEVSEAGEYEIKVKLPKLGCETSGSVKVEIYPAISKVVHQAEDIVVCRQSLEELDIDLTSVETAMFKDTDRSIYTTGYYKNAEYAEASENAILNVENYTLGKEPQAQTLYIRIENTVSGCHEVFVLHIKVERGDVPSKPSDVKVCAEYLFPEVNGDQYYYTEPGGEGQQYKAGDVLTEPGEHTIYLLQINSDEGCYEETSYKVNITAPVTADIFEDNTLKCELYTLQPLSEYNQYYTELGGKGMKLQAGTQILLAKTIYVYASSEDGLCTDESSFTIAYEDCPIPRGISPNNDGLNDVFDLTPHGVESLKIYSRWGTEVYAHGEGYTTQWHGQSKSGKQLPDGTYYYVIHAHGKTRTGWVQINK